MSQVGEEDLPAAGYRLGEALISAHRLDTVNPARFDSLSSLELRRAGGIRDGQSRHRFLAGRLTVRELVSARLGVDDRRVTACFECPSCSVVNDGSHGWPRYLIDGIEAGISVSFSREGDWLVAATTALTIAVPPVELRSTLSTVPSIHPSIGIDVEDSRKSAFVNDALDSVIASVEEAEALRHYEIPERPRLRAILWTRKEALLKATGHGLRLDPSSLDTGSFLTPRLRRWPSALTLADQLSLIDTKPADLGLPAPFTVAVAIRGSLLPRVLPR